MTAARPRPRSPRVRRLLAAAVAPLCAVVVAAPSPARAQDEPVVFQDRQRATDRVSFYNWHTALELEYFGQRSEIDPVGGPREKSSEDRFRQTIDVENQGHIIHPNLVDLDLYGRFGLEQDTIDRTGTGSETQHGTVYEWDARATILRKEDTPLLLYSRRNEQIINREFGPSLTDTITTTGAALDILNRPVVSRFEVFHQEREQSGLGGGDDVTGFGSGEFSMTQDSFLWHSEWRPDDRQLLTWDYGLSLVNEQTEGFDENEFTTHDAGLSHAISFGDRRQHDLLSSLSYFDQSGDFPAERFRFNELLRLQHTRNFQTRHQYTFDRNSFGDNDQTQHRARTGFIHRLYQSLTTAGNVGVQKLESSDDADSDSLFGDLNFDYRKRVPLGSFNGFLGGYFDLTDNDARGEPTQVVDEPRVFNDPQPIVIVTNGVNPDTIVITDPSGLLLYQEGLDYLLTVRDNRVEIDRVVGGRIGAGQAVLIDYVLNPQAANEVDTTGFYVGGRYNFERGALRGLSLYTRYGHQDQSIESDVPTEFEENSFDDLIYGAEYFIRGWTFGAEHQDHDSTIQPFDADRLFARYRRRVARETTLTLNSAYTTIDYPEDDNQVDFWTTSAVVRHQFTRQFYGVLTLLYRDEQDRFRGDTTGFEQQLELEWRHRQTTIYATLRNATLESETTDSNFQLFQVGVRREF